MLSLSSLIQCPGLVPDSSRFPLSTTSHPASSERLPIPRWRSILPANSLSFVTTASFPGLRLVDAVDRIGGLDPLQCRALGEGRFTSSTMTDAYPGIYHRLLDRQPSSVADDRSA